MLPEGRRNQILALLKQQGYCSVEELAEIVYVSVPTMRRDLTQLEREGLIKRVHGGASYLGGDAGRVIPFDLRGKSMVPEKMRIGEAAAKLLELRDTIFIDSSSTCLCLAKAISPKSEITVLTNSIVIAQTLAEYDQVTVELTGGDYSALALSLYGRGAEETISRRHAKYCFVAVSGMDKEFGLSNSTGIDVGVKRAFAQHAEKVVLLIDSSKVNRARYYKVFDYDDIDMIITDRPLDDELAETCEKYRIELRIV